MRRGLAARLRRTTTSLVALAAILVLAGFTSPSPTPTTSTASTASPRATASTAPTDSPLAVTVSVTQISPQVLRPNEDLTVQASLVNNSTQTISQPRVAVRLSRTALPSRSSLDAWTTADPTALAGTSVRGVALDAPLAPGARTAATLTVPAAALRLSTSTSAWGARGIAVEVTDGQARVGIDRTFILWLPADQSAQTEVSVLVPVVPDSALLSSAPALANGSSASASGGAGTGSSPSATSSPAVSSPPKSVPEVPAGAAGANGSTTATTGTDAGDFGPGSRLGKILALTAPRPAVSWAIDPSLVDRAAAEGDQAAPWLTAVGNAASGRDVYALPYSDPDLAAIAHAGAGALPLATQAISLAGTNAWVTEHAARTGLQLLAGTATDEATLNLAASIGTSAVVVAPDALAAGDLTYTPTGRADVKTPTGTLAALVPDQRLSSLLQSPGEATPAEAAQRILAETAVITRERPSEDRHLLLTVGRSWSPDLSIATAQLDALASAPWVSLAPVSSMVSTASPDVSRSGVPATNLDAAELPASEVGALVTAQAAVTTFASVVADPTGVLVGVPQAVLRPLALAWRDSTDGRQAVLSSTLDGLRTRQSGVSIIEGSDVNLIAKSSEVPIALRNTLDQAVTVTLRLRPRNSCLVVPTAPTVTVQAHETTSFRVPFSAVASCNVVVDVTLLAADGTPVASSTEFTVRVHADWENVGTAVLAGFLLLGLAFGLWRTIRRGQTARRGARVIDAPEAPGAIGPEAQTSAATTTPGPSLGRSVGVMAAGTAVSRVLGMVRGAMLVWAIGTTGLAADAFGLANMLPNVLVMLIAAGVINAVLVPQVVRAYKGGAGDDYVNRILTLGGTVLLGLTVILTAGSAVLIWLYSQGNPESIALATAFAFWCIPQVLFYGMYTLLGQVLNARGSFGPYMWAPVVNNVVAIAGLGVFLLVSGQYADAGPTSDPAWWTGWRVALLGGTATLGVAAQAVVLIRPLRRLGFHFHVRWGVRGVGLRSAARVAGWTFAALLVGQGGFLLATRVMTAANPTGAGVIAGNAAYTNAFTIFMLPHSLVTVSLLTAMFTTLSAHAAHGDTKAVRADFSSTARIIGVFTMIATAVLAVVAMPLTRVLYPSLHGSTVSAVSDVVVALVAGLAAMGLWSLCQRLSYAYEDARSLFWIQCAMAVVVAGGSWVARSTLPPERWVVGVAVAMSTSYVLGTVVAAIVLRRRLGGLDEARILRLYLKAGTAALAAAVIGVLLVHLSATVAPVTVRGLTGLLRAAVLCAVVGLVMTGVYAGLLRVMHVRELSDLVTPLLRRVRRLSRR